VRGASTLGEKVASNADLARLSKRLATVRSDLALNLRGEDLFLQTPHTQELLALADELEMRSLADRLRKLLGQDAGAPSKATADGTGRTPPAVEKPHAAVAQLHNAGAWQEIEGGEVYFLQPEDSRAGPQLVLSGSAKLSVISDPEAAAEAIANLAKRGVSFCGYDVKALCRRFGCSPGPLAFDLGVASYLYDASVGEHDAASIVARTLGEELITLDAGEGGVQKAIDQLQRAATVLREGLSARDQVSLYTRIELPLIRILAQMELRGVLVDRDLLSRLGTELGEKLTTLVGRIYAEAGGPFNILSPVQLRDVLFSRLGLPTKGLRQTKTGLSTDSDSLHALADRHPLPGLILEYRLLSKLKSTYIDVLPGLADSAGRVHTRFNQTVAATGRLSSTDPNLQNIPVRSDVGSAIRRAFIAPPGWRLLSADYNQIELRVLAHLSRDAALVDSFEQGLDIHRATASELFGVPTTGVTPEMRRVSKVVNYGILYGMGAGRMSRELSIPRPEAAAYIDRYFARYSGVRRLYAENLAQARDRGYVSTITGRRRYLPDITSSNGGLRQAAERVAGNSPIQGSAADIIKAAMVELSMSLDREHLESAMVLQIHDELLLECPAGEVERVSKLTASAMERAMPLAVPVVVDIGVGANWAEAH
jgi:DNA polymerase-1